MISSLIQNVVGFTLIAAGLIGCGIQPAPSPAAPPLVVVMIIEPGPTVVCPTAPPAAVPAAPVHPPAAAELEPVPPTGG